MAGPAWLVTVWLAASVGVLDGPADNQAGAVRQVPKPGIAVPDDVRAELTTEVASLREEIGTLATRTRPDVLAALPDIEVCARAVADALQYNEFFAPGEFDKARQVLAEGRRRADHLLSGEGAPWTRQKGLVVRAYRSRLDDSIQPFGLVIPDSYDFQGTAPVRLDVWFHGRAEALSELNFVHDRMTSPGSITPADTIVLHPYGRFCNAFKLAGEVDVEEAIDAVRRMYRIDPDRISVRGFSMGGAAVWHMAVHRPTEWFAANPGAGFAETPRFLKVFQKENLSPPWYEKTLWSLYDCDQWAGNLRLVPTVAYSGENDSQKQAADVMAEALAPYGIALTHIIGPGMGHQYDAASLREVDRRLATLAHDGRRQPSIRDGFETFSLRYNEGKPFVIDRLEEHWKHASVALVRPGSTELSTRNVAAFHIDLPPGSVELDRRPVTQIDFQEVDSPLPGSDRSWRAAFHKEGTTWKVGPAPEQGLHKIHGLQGPIDDAFLDRFVFVTPTGQSTHPRFQAWCEAELARAADRWRRQFRGVALSVPDIELSDEQIARSNLIVWGDPRSNSVLRKIADRLPITWTEDEISVGDQRFSAADHAPILVFPNPLNPARYVVLNSGFTYREYDDLNNARQTPKLPDWAIVNLNTAPDRRWPGRVVAADFFDEAWKLKLPVKTANSP